MIHDSPFGACFLEMMPQKEERNVSKTDFSILKVLIQVGLFSGHK
jgi:hypothetical protein